MSCKIESGVQLFSRLNTRDTLKNLYPNIFINGGPFSQEIAEIIGELSTGKTFIVTEIIAFSVLPTDYKSLNIGGKNSEVILIDTDHHFDLFCLINVMEKILKDNRISSTEIEHIVQKSLKNLTILSCYDGPQMFITFHNLREILTENPNISLIIIDSVSAYFWSDTGITGLKKFDLYVKDILKNIQAVISQFKITLIYTKPAYFKSKVPLKYSNDQCSKELKIDRVNYRVVLSEDRTNNRFKAEMSVHNQTVIKYYEIKSNCVKWSS